MELLSKSKFIVLLLALNLTFMAVGQSRPDEMPVYPGCEQSTEKMTCFKKQLLSHISENFNSDFLKKIKDADQVNMMINFTIVWDGTLSDFDIKSPYDFLNDEMQRVLLLVPKLTPAKSNGEPVAMQYSLPVNFEIKK